MTGGRLVLLLLVLGIGFYLYKRSASSVHPSSDDPSSSPIDRARAAARKSQERGDRIEGVKREADSPAGQVTENMTPDQVRALLGPPDVVETDDGAPRQEKWIYRAAGKTVIFENGIAVAIR